MTSILCQYCGEFTSSPNHVDSQTGVCKKSIEKPKLLCEICGIQVKNNKNLKFHQLLHSDNCFQCDMCEATFKDKRYLNRHRKFHNNTGVVCKICHRNYYHKSNLNRHMLKHC